MNKPFRLSAIALCVIGVGQTARAATQLFGWMRADPGGLFNYNVQLASTLSP